jgi:hypothetical protein
MKPILFAALVLCTLASPAIAARMVYLKDGGVIQAKAVWRSHGKVRVLVNRDTLTEFWPEELNMKLTFVKHHRAARKKPAVAAQQAETAAPNGAAVVQNPREKKTGMSLPKLPALREAKPDNLMPGNNEGTIKKHQREMQEKVNE